MRRLRPADLAPLLAAITSPTGARRGSRSPRRTALLRRKRSGVRSNATTYLVFAPMSRSGEACLRPVATSSPHLGLLDGLGRGLSLSMSGKAPSSAPRSQLSSATSRKPEASWPRTRVNSRSAGVRPKLGLSLLLAARRLFRRQGVEPIGATRTMEDFIYFSRYCVDERKRAVAPVYGIVRPTDARAHADLLAAILAMGRCASECGGRTATARCLREHHPCGAPMSSTKRLPTPGDENLFRFSSRSAKRPPRSALERTQASGSTATHPRAHLSAAMCWAGCNRLAAIAAQSTRRARPVLDAKAEAIRKPCWSARGTRKRQAFTGRVRFDDLTQVVSSSPNSDCWSERSALRKHCFRHRKELFKHNNVMRLRPPTISVCPKLHFSFVVLVDRRLVVVGPGGRSSRVICRCSRTAKSLRHAFRGHRSTERSTLGKLPANYSMEGMILSAMSLSRSWEDRYWRG